MGFLICSVNFPFLILVKANFTHLVAQARSFGVTYDFSFSLIVSIHSISKITCFLKNNQNLKGQEAKTSQ